MRILISFLSLLATFSLWAQPTTEEEFNYMSKGYKIQVESGLDMKKGYSLQLLDSMTVPHSAATRHVRFLGLFREGSTTPCGIIGVVKRMDNGVVTYLCLPSHDAPDALWQKAVQGLEQYKDNLPALGTVMASLIHLASKGYTEPCK